MTQIFIISGTSWTVPSDWSEHQHDRDDRRRRRRSAASNRSVRGGGGGGGYSKISDLAGLSGTRHDSSRRRWSGGAAGTAGMAGGDTWFNGATLGRSSVGAKGGTAGAPGNGGAGVGGSGGEQVGNTGGVGTTKNKGGNGELEPWWQSCGWYGGGGGGGPNGDGAAGSAANTNSTQHQRRWRRWRFWRRCRSSGASGDTGGSGGANFTAIAGRRRGVVDRPDHLGRLALATPMERVAEAAAPERCLVPICPAVVAASGRNGTAHGRAAGAGAGRYRRPGTPARAVAVVMAAITAAAVQAAARNGIASGLGGNGGNGIIVVTYTPAISATIVAESRNAMEHQAVGSTDAFEALEFGLSVPSDVAVATEGRQGIRCDGETPIEASRAVLRSSLIPIQWAGSLALYTDALMPFETAAELRRDTLGFVEFACVTLSNVQIRLELLGIPGSDVLLPAEWLTNGARISADGPLCFEWVGPPSLLIVAPERLLRSPGRIRIVAGPDSIHPLRGD